MQSRDNSPAAGGEKKTGSLYFVCSNSLDLAPSHFVLCVAQCLLVRHKSHLPHVSFSDIQIPSGAAFNDKSSLLLGHNYTHVANFLISLPLPSSFIAKYHLRLNEVFLCCSCCCCFEAFACPAAHPAEVVIFCLGHHS